LRSLGVVIPGRRAAANPESMNTDLSKPGLPVLMDSGQPRTDLGSTRDRHVYDLGARFPE